MAAQMRKQHGGQETLVFPTANLASSIWMRSAAEPPTVPPPSPTQMVHAIPLPTNSRSPDSRAARRRNRHQALPLSCASRLTQFFSLGRNRSNLSRRRRVVCVREISAEPLARRPSLSRVTTLTASAAQFRLVPDTSLSCLCNSLHSPHRFEKIRPGTTLHSRKSSRAAASCC